MKIGVLGAGMVGRTIAKDLAKNFDVTSFDISEANLSLLHSSENIHTIPSDLTDTGQYAQMLKPFDMLVNAVPGFMGYKTLEAIINAGKNVVDISFFPEDALQLNTLAIANNVTAIVDCGVAPGMSNLILGYYNELMQVDSFECMVGGLPKKRIKPFEYKAPFSPVDVIEEYTRPARYVENGHIVTKPALSDAELIDFDFVGTLESFNTDGLRSILFTMNHIPNMKEKTLRYPGHIDLIKAFEQAGFFSNEIINVKGNKIRAIDFTTSLLFDKWKLEPEEAEFTLMKIILTGKMEGKQTKVEYFLYDEYDAVSKTASMSRTTGYTCTAAVNLIIEKKFTAKGVFPPELIAKEKGCFEFIINYLRERNVVYKKTISN
ncbi:MAG: saccharopine dehydrogenase NADP-binding domain-containing protein [Bacteroidetes bacterium]|nr:saccharopine dehydrogenase NADP-binding domain-containing protein [Bacteroidota bacterium]MBS1757585.1 saccharopine dehydrogenase NADP-binding domain-containing protein [Bacteroidota bacterium]